MEEAGCDDGQPQVEIDVGVLIILIKEVGEYGICEKKGEDVQSK